MKTTFKKEKRQSINTYAHEYQQKSLIKINTPKYTHLPKTNKKQLQYRLCQTQLCQDCQSLQDQIYTSEKHPV